MNSEVQYQVHVHLCRNTAQLFFVWFFFSLSKSITVTVSYLTEAGLREAGLKTRCQNFFHIQKSRRAEHIQKHKHMREKHPFDAHIIKLNILQTLWAPMLSTSQEFIYIQSSLVVFCALYVLNISFNPGRTLKLKALNNCIQDFKYRMAQLTMDKTEVIVVGPNASSALTSTHVSSLSTKLGQYCRNLLNHLLILELILRYQSIFQLTFVF